jgi:acid phosphatase type 7
LRSLTFAIVAVLVGVLGAAAAENATCAVPDASPVTIAATGDVRAPHAKDVSDAILAHPSVSAVLIAGDTSNDTPTPLSSYRDIYKGTYDRFLSKIYPCPGNHDFHASPPFSGYCEFWGKIAHCPEMYYSFDIGGWHIVSLDSVTFQKDVRKAATQLDWLKADLAEKPKTPVFAFWHYPLFSRAKHGGLSKMKPFWDVLYAHGPAIVLNGHNHVYERYPPLDPDGKPVPEAKGIQEFLVCPGGANPTKTESSAKLDGPPSAKFHGDAQHVGFFTLYVDGGFRYVIHQVGRGGTTALVEAGGGNLLGGPVPK